MKVDLNHENVKKNLETEHFSQNFFFLSPHLFTHIVLPFDIYTFDSLI